MQLLVLEDQINAHLKFYRIHTSRSVPCVSVWRFVPQRPIFPMRITQNTINFFSILLLRCLINEPAGKKSMCAKFHRSQKHNNYEPTFKLHIIFLFLLSLSARSLVPRLHHICLVSRCCDGIPLAAHLFHHLCSDSASFVMCDDCDGMPITMPRWRARRECKLIISHNRLIACNCMEMNRKFISSGHCGVPHLLLVWSTIMQKRIFENDPRNKIKIIEKVEN